MSEPDLHYYPRSANVEIDGRKLKLVGMISDQTMKHGRRRAVSRLLIYGVFEWDERHVTASPRGTVKLQSHTMERKTPGRMYVDARWYAPRWAYEVTGADRQWPRLQSGYVTRSEALKRLLWAFDRLQTEKKDAQ